jgi:hypothetical protein
LQRWALESAATLLAEARSRRRQGQGDDAESGDDDAFDSEHAPVLVQVFSGDCDADGFPRSEHVVTRPDAKSRTKACTPGVCVDALLQALAVLQVACCEAAETLEGEE